MVKKGINIVSVSEDTKREDMPKEVRDMFELVDSIVHNTVKICAEKDISVTLLPSIYLHALNKVTPMMVESIVKSGGKEEAQFFLDGVKSIVKDSFDVEKVMEK